MNRHRIMGGDFGRAGWALTQSSPSIHEIIMLTILAISVLSSIQLANWAHT